MAFFLGFLTAGVLGTIWYLAVTLSGGAVQILTEA